MNLHRLSSPPFSKFLTAVCLALFLGASSRAVTPTEGCLQIIDAGHASVKVCPLEHTEVQVDISGFVARVTLVQQFRNPLNEPIEAVYTFPMSSRAAVDAMSMEIGDRTIKGLVKTREEAREAYEKAKSAGQAASLLDQERPNIFTQSVANILPGDTVKVRISYVEYLEYRDGQYTFAFPMVVGPRYIPGEMRVGGTDQVPDAGRITPPVTPEGTRAGHDVSVSVTLDAGFPLQDMRSELHDVDIERISDTRALIRLREKKEIPNRDFILHYAVAGSDIQDAVMTHTEGGNGYFTLIVQPPAQVKPKDVSPKEMMFIIDCSGSMRGFPIEKAKRTMRMCIEQMNPDDTFNLVSFAGGTGYCFDRPVPNTRANRERALAYLEALEGSGGTEMMTAIRAALEKQNDSERLRVVCFMTDGFIGNDMAILDAVRENVDKARVFAFGIGSSVNRFLIEGMGRLGRGDSEIVTLESDSDEAAQRFHERIHSPLLTDISIDFGGLPVGDIYPDPGALPDLFASRPLILKGRYAGQGAGTIVVRGRTAQGDFERRVNVDLPAQCPDHDVLAPLWARERIAWLMDQDWLGMQRGQPNKDVQGEITRLGLAYSLVTQYTSFVAVEERQITQGGQTKTIQVPVEMPDGVSYEGVFGESREAALGLAGGVATGAMPMSAPIPVILDSARPTRARPQSSNLTPKTVERETKPAPPVTKVEPIITDSDKLAVELRGLAGKLREGSYKEKAIEVVHGWVEVHIKLKDNSDAHLDELKRLGVKIVAHARANRLVLARIKVDDLNAIASLEYVEKIMPPKM